MHRAVLWFVGALSALSVLAVVAACSYTINAQGELSRAKTETKEEPSGQLPPPSGAF